MIYVIYFRTKPYNNEDCRDFMWIPINPTPSNRIWDDYNFDYAIYKIGETVYTEFSKEFKKAVEAEILWEQLQKTSKK